MRERLHGEYKVPGGKLVAVDLSVSDGRLAEVQVSGDFFLDPDEALPLIDRAVVLNLGRVLMQGLPSEVVRHPDVIRAYLGDRYAA